MLSSCFVLENKTKIKGEGERGFMKDMIEYYGFINSCSDYKGRRDEICSLVRIFSRLLTTNIYYVFERS